MELYLFSIDWVHAGRRSFSFRFLNFKFARNEQVSSIACSRWVIRGYIIRIQKNFFSYSLNFFNNKKILLPHRKYSTVSFLFVCFLFFFVWGVGGGVVSLQLVDDVIG
jgi:hypothetical protein